MRKEINLFDHTNEIIKEMQEGALLTTKCDGKVNTMAIGWGMLGIQWSKPVFVAMIRESRYTKELLEKTGEFTVNVPYGEYDKKILGYCGSKSGRDTDKIKDMGLTLVDGVAVDVPAIKELPLTLECKVIYKQKQDSAAISEADKADFYSDEDYHIYYFAEVVGAYIVE